jgi:hypothetical protein
MNRREPGLALANATVGPKKGQKSKSGADVMCLKRLWGSQQLVM